MEEKIKLANLFYDFVSEFKRTLQTKNNDNTDESETLKTVKNIMEDFYMRDSMYFVLRKDKLVSINELIDMLSSESGTRYLLGKLENTFCDTDDYINQIEDLDYITKDLVNKEQLSTIVKRKFECDDDFKKSNYLELYYKYKDLDNKLISHYKQFN